MCRKVKRTSFTDEKNDDDRQKKKVNKAFVIVSKYHVETNNNIIKHEYQDKSETQTIEEHLFFHQWFLLL